MVTPLYTWPNAARLAVSIVVNLEEGAEATIADGDRAPEPVDELGITLKRAMRNYGNESNYQYGIKAGAPRVLRALDARGITATFTAAAVALERAPDLARHIVAAGHEVCAHGYRWVHQFHMSQEEERTFIRRAVESITATTGTRPYGWLSRYLLTEHTRRLLLEEGFTYHMDDYSDDAPFWDRIDDKAIVILPYALDNNDMKFWTAPAFIGNCSKPNWASPWTSNSRPPAPSVTSPALRRDKSRFDSSMPVRSQPYDGLSPMR